MPYQEIRVAPELFLSHNGVNVYHTYGDDNINDGPKNYWFTVKPSESEEENEAFDVHFLDVPSRQLLEAHPPFISLDMPDDERKRLRALWSEWQSPNGEIQAIRSIIMEAIDAGLIVAGEDNVIEGDENYTEGMLDWELIGKSMKAANIPRDITPLETESQFVARMIDDLYARCGEPSLANAMRVKTWQGLRPVAEFDEVEIHAMCDGEDEGGLWQSSDCPGESPVAYTVFLHCVAGGIETVQDFRFDPSDPGGEQSARKDAEMLAEQLYDMLRAVGTLLAR